MITRWVHLQELGSVQWVLPIYTAVRLAAAAGRCAELPSLLSECGLHLTTRLNLLELVRRRVDASVDALHGLARENFDDKHVSTDEHEGIALAIGNEAKYLVIADLDSYLFEVNAGVDLFKRFLFGLQEHVGQPVSAEPKELRIQFLNDIMARHGVDPEWFSLLDSYRNFTAHAGTPYLAIDVTDFDRWEFLVTRENIRQFNNPKKYFRLARIKTIDEGFRLTLEAVGNHLRILFA